MINMTDWFTIWEDILKAPYPNRLIGNRKERGNRRIKEGTGKYGLFRYNEINERIGYDGIREEIDEAYEKEIQKVIRRNIRESKKKLGDRYTPDLEKYLKRRITRKLTEQKKNNLYATTYGKDAKGAFGEVKTKPTRWFTGYRKLGYDPKDEEGLKKLINRIVGVGKMRFIDWEEQAQKEREKENEKFRETVSLSGWSNYPSLADDYNKGPLSGKDSAKAESAKIITANAEGKSIAHIIVLEISDGRTWFHELSVDRGYRRKGVAGMLMEQLIETYGNTEITGLIIPSGRMSEGQLARFYKRYGFKTRTVPTTDGTIAVEIKRG